MKTKDEILSEHFNEIEEENQLSVIQKELIKNAMDEFATLQVKNNSVQPDVSGSVCCNAKLIKLTTYGYDECIECGKTYKQTDR